MVKYDKRKQNKTIIRNVKHFRTIANGLATVVFVVIVETAVDI